MPETITAYYSFTANTRAKAAEVTTNFSNYRGTYLPIRTDTATAADDTYSLGNDSYRFTSVYCRSVDLRTSTTTASLVFSGVTTATTGAFQWTIEGVTVGVMTTQGLNGSLIKPSSVTAGSILLNYTMTGYLGTIQATAGASPLCTMTITTAGNPVHICAVSSTLTDTAASATLQINQSGFFTHFVDVVRNGSTIASLSFLSTTTTVSVILSPHVFTFEDRPSAGINTYVLYGRIAAGIQTWTNARFSFRELK